jgi:hypothetical protein
MHLLAIRWTSTEVSHAYSRQGWQRTAVRRPDKERTSYGFLNQAPAVGFEPTTNRLTADRSTTELRWIFCRLRVAYMLPTGLLPASLFFS